MVEANPAQPAAVRRSLAALLITIAVMVALLFAPAGTLDWPLGWLFLFVFILAVLLATATLWCLNPDIFVARSRVQPGTKTLDYFFIALVMAGFVCIAPVAGLDFRFGWSRIPQWLVWVGYMLFCAELCRTGLAAGRQSSFRAGRPRPEGSGANRHRHGALCHRAPSRLHLGVAARREHGILPRFLVGAAAVGGRRDRPDPAHAVRGADFDRRIAWLSRIHPAGQVSLGAGYLVMRGRVAGFPAIRWCRAF